MEDDLQKKIEDDLKNKNGRPQYFEDGREPHFYLAGRRH
jgi:hypothetical protein